MKRRAYLTTTAIALGGCAGIEGSDAPEETNSSNETDDGSDADDGSDTDEESEPKPEQAGAETIDDFEDLSNWTVVAGSASADDGRQLVGTQSVRLEAAPSDTHAVISREFDSPRDFSDVAPSLAVNVGKQVAPFVQLFDADGDRVDFRRTVTTGQPFMRYNFGVADVAGDPDLSSVTEIRVGAWAGRGQVVRFWVDDLHTTPRPETGTVLIQFDDAHDTDYTEALPILEEYGYPATTFVNTDRIGAGSVGGDQRLSLEQLEGLRDAGWLVGSHTASHVRLSDLDADGQEADVREAKTWLVDNGFEEGARYFAYPFGDYDATTLEVVADHHALGFGAAGTVEGYATNPVLCSRVSPPNAARAREILDRTAAFRGITSLFYHRLEGESLANFRAMVEALHEREAAGDLAVALPSDVEAEYTV